MSYFTLMPKYRCQDAESGNWFECVPEEFCLGDIKREIDYSNQYSLRNWIEQYHLECESSWTMSLILASYFIGQTCTILWIPALVEEHGRSLIYKIGIVGTNISFLLIYLTSSVSFLIFTMFVFGALSPARNLAFWNYMMDFIPLKYQSKLELTRQVI
jgi:MFS family permease